MVVLFHQLAHSAQCIHVELRLIVIRSHELLPITEMVNQQHMFFHQRNQYLGTLELIADVDQMSGDPFNVLLRFVIDCHSFADWKYLIINPVTGHTFNLHINL